MTYPVDPNQALHRNASVAHLHPREIGHIIDVTVDINTIVLDGMAGAGGIADTGGTAGIDAPSTTTGGMGGKVNTGGITGAGGGIGGLGGAAGGAGGSAGTGPQHPSCVGLPATCGPAGNESCCTSLLVPGGTFNRSNDPSYTATMSDFYLDKYEITVGRFRAFVNAGMGAQASPPTANVGAHPLIAGSGWNATWNTSLAADTSAVRANLKRCSFETWTDTVGSNEDRPVNCISWCESFAFFAACGFAWLVAVKGCTFDSSKLRWQTGNGGLDSAADGAGGSPVDAGGKDAGPSGYDAGDVAKDAGKKQDQHWKQERNQSAG